MLTTFGSLAVRDYFTLEGDNHVYRKVDERNAWIFHCYYRYNKSMPLYVCHAPRGGPKDTPFSTDQVVRPCAAPD